MAFNVRLYSLSKRDNSTKRPEGEGRLLACKILRGSSMMNPVFEFDFGTENDGNPVEYNYMYIYVSCYFQDILLLLQSEEEISCYVAE